MSETPTDIADPGASSTGTPSALREIRGAIGACPGLIVAAPSSGSGKTVIALALMKALSRRGRAVASLKIGPDYIDPAFHAVACGRESSNLDPWAMRPEMRLHQIARQSEGADFLIAEGVMGLFDGAADGTGSTADVAAMTEWPVILVIDVKGQAASAVAVLHGFRFFREDTHIAGVIFNNVGGPGHEAMLRDAMNRRMLGFPVLGFVPRDAALTLPSRHLGLVQAGEHPDLATFIDEASLTIARHVDLDAVEATAAYSPYPPPDSLVVARPPGQHVAVARDQAFAFCYPHLMEAWRAAGAEISFFSPLDDVPPEAEADAVYLPGGYPELHGEGLAAAGRFKAALTDAAGRGVPIYGECGGYMVLGRGLVDADGGRHEMLGLLPLETSFAERKLSLGYRGAEVVTDTPLLAAGGRFRGHEFHYATVLEEGDAPPLFHLTNARGDPLGATGLAVGSVAGSFLHLVDLSG